MIPGRIFPLVFILVLVLGACAPAADPTMVEAAAPDEFAAVIDEPIPAEGPMMLENLGPAPELHNEIWLNTDAPLRLAELRGRVVLLEMWTFGCINCKNVIPSLIGWHEQFSDQGLVIIGNHYPEFSYEADLGNLEDAIIRLGIPYAVAQDNDRLTWGAYNNRYWPTLYLIDKQGDIRYVHIGEGAYAKTEAAIVQLLEEPVQ